MVQEIIDIEKMDLLNQVLNLKNVGYRLAQICATKLEKFILLYSFIREDILISLRFTAETTEAVESISWLYSYAFLYENEIKDLFGINILNMNLDFNGHFYDTMVKTPFNQNEQESAVNNNG